MNERGITIQTVIITAVMALVAVVVGVVIFNIVSDESEDIKEAVEEVSDITLFTEEAEECPAGQVRNDQTNECVLEEPVECPAGQVRIPQTNECEELVECPDGQVRSPLTNECEEEILDSQRSIVGLQAGNLYTCAIIGGSDLDSTEDEVRCWGDNQVAQLGEALGQISQTPAKIPGLENVRALSIGDDHACAVVRDSGSTTTAVECWGSNQDYASGQPIGDASSLKVTRPKKVAGVAGVQAIAAGNAHTCVIAVAPITDEETVECWGTRYRGVLGAEPADIPLDSTQNLIPRNTVEQLSEKDLKALEAGGNFTCAIVGGDQPDGSADTVWCWGVNEYNQLGKGGVRKPYSADPIRITGLTGVKAISAAPRHVCAIVGGNQPDGSADTVWCWGDQASFDGTSDSRFASTPAEISDFEGARSVEAGPNSTCIITFTNNYKCIGFLARDGLEDGANQPEVLFIAVGLNHTCIAYMDNTVKCFGSNSRSQIGKAPINIPYHIPNKIQDTSGARRVSVGNYIGCFITSSDALKCWGRNAYGQLNLPAASRNDDSRTDPVEISGLTGVTDISNTHQNAYCVIAAKSAQNSEKGVKCRGDNYHGVLGQDPSELEEARTDFVDVTQVSNPRAVSNFYDHTCAIVGGDQSDGSADTVWCWGQNRNGEIVPRSRDYGELRSYVAPEMQTILLNESETRTRKEDERTAPLTGVKALSAGGEHTCAIAAEIDVSSSYVATPTGEDAVYCWGANRFGQLGILDSSTQAFWPREIPGLNGAKAISAGHSYTCIITAEDTVKCWGRNNFGQLGTEPFSDAVARLVRFVDVPGLKRVSAISAGAANVCAIAAVLDAANEPTSEDAIYCWGKNQFGLIGAPFTVDDSPERVLYSAIPVRIQGITTPTDISAGSFTVCAIAADLDGDNNPTGQDAIYCWGNFDSGARGVLHIPGTTTHYSVGNHYSEPLQISGL